MGQGKENAKNFLRDNPKLATEIRQKIKGHLGLPVKEKKDEPKDGKK